MSNHYISSKLGTAKSTVPKIKKLTDDIKANVTIVSEKSTSSLHASQEQAAASEEITTSICLSKS